jgi:small subunit ribosomal protein S13
MPDRQPSWAAVRDLQGKPEAQTAPGIVGWTTVRFVQGDLWMARIAGIDLRLEKRIEIALTSIYGIGRGRSLEILASAKVEPEQRVKDLTEQEVSRIRQIIDRDGGVEGDLRKDIQINIKRLIEIGSYRGLRHRRNMPVRGQKTKTNARTRKGPRRLAVKRKQVARH